MQIVNQDGAWVGVEWAEVGGGDTGFVADAPRVLELLLALLLQLLLPSESITCYSNVLPRTAAGTILLLTLQL